MLQYIYRRLFGKWQEAYITTKESEFIRLTELLKDNKILYKYKLKTSPDREPVYNEKVYYISVLDKDMPIVKELFGLVPKIIEA